MKGIRIDKGAIIYYGNAAGYLSDGQAVVDPMFRSQEFDDFLKEQPQLRCIAWREGVFEQLAEGGREPEAIIHLKKCRIWQLKPDTDIMKRFVSYEETRGRFGEPSLQDYQVVFDGSVESNDLEDIDFVFNQFHPPGYTGHSLSMSDIVELYDKSGSEFYYCDRVGFQAIEVEEPNQRMDTTLNSEKEKRIETMVTVDAKINAMYPAGAMGGVRAYASATIAGCLAVRGIRVIEGKEGLFVSMPSRKIGEEYKENVFPVTKEFRQQLHNTILDAYQQALTQNQTPQTHTQGQSEEPQSGMQMGSM